MLTKIPWTLTANKTHFLYNICEHTSLIHKKYIYNHLQDIHRSARNTHSHSTLIWWVLQLSSNSVYPPRAQPARNLNFDLWRTKVPHDLIVSFDTHNGSHHDLSLLSLSQLSQQRKYVRTNQNKKRKGRIRLNKKHLFIADASSLILVQFSHFLFVKPNYAMDSLSWWFQSDTSVKIPLYDQWFVCVCVCVCVCASGQHEGRMMTGWPSHVPVVIFHRGHPLKIHGMQRPHESLFLVSPFLSLILNLYHHLPFSFPR